MARRKIFLLLWSGHEKVWVTLLLSNNHFQIFIIYNFPVIKKKYIFENHKMSYAWAPERVLKQKLFILYRKTFKKPLQYFENYSFKLVSLIIPI